jgi:hypothetical protein
MNKIYTENNKGKILNNFIYDANFNSYDYMNNNYADRAFYTLPVAAYPNDNQILYNNMKNDYGYKYNNNVSFYNNNYLNNSKNELRYY